MSQQQHIDLLEDHGSQEIWVLDVRVGGQSVKRPWRPLDICFRPVIVLAQWTPSCHGSKKPYFKAEDGLPLSMCLGIDATQISDRKPVMFKQLLHKEGPYELQINRLFSTVPLTSNPQNHCCINIMIPQFELSGNSSLSLHKYVSDCTYKNIVLDPSGMILSILQIQGKARIFVERNLAREDYIQVWMLVYVLQNIFLTPTNQKYHGLKFMQPLIADMVQEDPTRRPNMDEVVSHFAEMKKKLGSRMARSIELWPIAAWRNITGLSAAVFLSRQYLSESTLKNKHSPTDLELQTISLPVKADKWKYKHDGTEA
ncbi:hypothetical protein EI94DRAFT_1883160 [Lactarius quietus]|nr:hypothetical protein EI94DRAFT_1883160 [Lactarius quietus]